MEEEAPNQKTNTNPSQPKPDGLKPNAIKWKKKNQIKKQKKNPSYLKPDGLKLKSL